MTLLTSLEDTLRTGPWRMDLLHSTDDHRLILISEGHGNALHDGKRCGVGPGHLIHIPARHCFALDMGPHASGHVLRISTNANYAEDWPVDPFLAHQTDLQDYSNLLTFIDILDREQDAAQPHGNEFQIACITLISVWLRRYLVTQPRAMKLTAAQKLLRRFLAELDAQYDSGAPMAQYAHQLNVTPTHLSRVCKSTLGHSAAELIVERILHAARVMLEDTDIPAKDIAAKLGFGSAAYFSRFIHKQTGSTPKSLRAKKRKCLVSSA